MGARPASDRRIGWLVVLAGGLIALAVQVAAPVGVPLYDGVVVVEPYRYLHPSGDQAGSPTSYAQPRTVTEAVSPALAGATSESPPQAQLIAQDDAFELTEGATSITVSITPIEPPPAPDGATIAGNVYRFEVTDQDGNPLAAKPCEGCRSLLLRAPEEAGEGTLKRYADGAWMDVETVHAGIVDLYQTNATILGDYAVVVDGSTQPQPGDGNLLGLDLDPLILLGGGVLIVLIVGFMVFVWWRTRPAQTPGTQAARGSGRIPLSLIHI